MAVSRKKDFSCRTCSSRVTFFCFCYISSCDNSSSRVSSFPISKETFKSENDFHSTLPHLTKTVSKTTKVRTAP